MKNLLIQWETEKENRKIYKVWFDEKPPNLQVRYFLGKKLRADRAEKRSKTSLFAW